ncbi:DUF1573 domain-containing protein [Patiriisocius marinus]|uniref:DUF1573 domain-containing protein n=1 Tax=Patiriisocius marinus TaxID=1397112 RepID=A0A5J4J3L7_9FLAO|nr:DUF1573 domain-containing protein [Patiriisocius marinus]GER60411.1 hypothetical protein ULMA_25190 [Patiriisocius marinus]
MKNIYVLLFAAFVSASTFAQETFNATKEGPRFTLNSREISTTTDKINETKIVKISFLNDGTEPLLLTDKNSSCACLATEMPKEVKPGESGELKVHFTPKRTGDYSETIYVKTNAQQHPFRLNFKASVQE